MENKINFTDRDPLYPNRRKITILQQQGNEIIADIEMQDEPKNNQTGTPINASVFNNFQDIIEDSFDYAKEANDIVNNLTVTSTILEAGELPSVNLETASNKRKNIKFGIPKAKTGTSIRMRGVWNATTYYYNNTSYIDVVTLNGCSYYCKITNKNNTPADNSDTTYWGLMSAHGNNAPVTIVDNLVSTEASHCLSAKQGKVLKTSIDSLNNSAVKISGNQSINGQKTFLASPVVPTPEKDDDSKKVATTEWVKENLKEFNSLPIGSIITSAIPITDDCVHLLDGGEIEQSGIYAEFTAFLKKLVSEGNELCCTNAEFNNSLIEFGQCGKFVINDATSKIRLPKITEFIASSISNLTGENKPIGLAQLDTFKSHAHTFTRYDGMDDKNFSGHVSDGVAANDTNWTTSETGPIVTTSFVGEGETRPKNIRYPYYIVLANKLKTDVQVNFDNIATDLNGKADNSLSNVTFPANIAGVTTTGAGDRVVETFISKDKTWWYRKWTSGWKECGMTVTTPSGSTTSYFTYIVSLPIAFSNSNYNVSTVSVNGHLTGNVSDVAWLSAQSNLVFSRENDKVNIMALYNKQISIYCCGF